MADIRIHRAKLNVMVSLCSQLVVMVCGIIVPKLMLDAFGSELYGATASIAQFLSYVTLLEGGIGGVVRAALYKPLAENNRETISGIMQEVKGFFRKIAFVFLAYALVMAFAFKDVSHLEVLDWGSTFFLVLVISLSTASQYFIGISNTLLLNAAQKVYVTQIVHLSGTLLNALLVALLIALKCDIIVVKLVSSVVFALRPIVLWLYVKRHYQLPKVRKTEKTYLTQKWSGLSQHIAYFLHTNTDIVILTLFVNLKAVAVYSVYNMVVANIQNLTISFMSGMEALFGDMLAKREEQKLSKVFGRYEMIVSVIAVMLFSVTFVMILPFVKIYTAGITDVNYEEPLFACILIIAALTHCIRMPYHSLVIAAGHFKQTQWAAYGEASINVLLSLVLVSQYGMVGVAIGTLAATVFRLIYYVGYLSKKILRRGVLYFVKRSCANAVAFLAASLIGLKITELFNMNDYGIWAACGAITALTASVVCIGINVLFYPQEILRLLRRRIAAKRP